MFEAESQANFFQLIADQLVSSNMKWNLYDGKDYCFVDDDNVDEATPAVLNTGACVPTSLEIIPAKIGTKMKVCQVCSYEMWRLKWKLVMLCLNHDVHLCTEVQKSQAECEPKLVRQDGTPVTNWDWTCPKEDTCWNKFHDFYFPNGLFNNNISLTSPSKCKFAGVVYSSELYQKNISPRHSGNTQQGKAFWQGINQRKSTYGS
jgi:hypothetical protein